MAKNIKSLQLLRNTNQLYATREDALTALTANTPPTGTQDGTPVLARYKGADDKIYTLVGFYADKTKIGGSISGETNMTVFDYEGSAADVKELKQKIGSGVTVENNVTKQLQDLSGNSVTSVSADTSVEGAKRYADEKVRAALDALDANSVADDNKIVSDVTQTDGKITATAKNVTEVKLAGLSATADTKIAATDTLGGALAKLQGQIDSMDKAASSADGEVVITVVETDGKVTEEKSKLKDVLLTGYAKTNDTGDIAAADSVNVALSKLENKVGANKITNADHSIVVTEPTGEATTTDIKVNIKNGEKVIKLDSDGIYTNLSLVKITDDLPTTVKERYELHDSDNAKIGESIDIAKDSHIVSITYITDSGDTHYQNLEYKYIDASGNTKTEYVDMKSLVLETEFDSGVTVTNGIAHGVVDTTSEKNSGGTAFLTVGKDGFKVDGIKQEIIDRINELDATLENGTTAGAASTGHVKVSITETNGKLTALTVSETNIADADDLAALSAKTVTEVASSNGSITVASGATTAADGTVKYDIITDASKIKMTGFTSTDVLSGINATSSVTEAFKEVDKVITDNERVVSNALNDLEETKVENITVNGVNGTFSNKVASVTIDGADIKLDGYASGSSSAAVVATDTVNQAIGKLENQVKAAVDGGLQAVESGNGISVTAVANNKQTISVKLKEGVSTPGSEWENPLKFDNNGGLYFDSLDCGTY